MEKDKGVTDLSDRDIKTFCNECQRLNPETGLICILGPRYQIRVVRDKWCGNAVVEGVEGRMTEKGFEPHQNIEKTSK